MRLINDILALEFDTYTQSLIVVNPNNVDSEWLDFYIKKKPLTEYRKGSFLIPGMKCVISFEIDISIDWNNEMYCAILTTFMRKCRNEYLDKDVDVFELVNGILRNYNNDYTHCMIPGIYTMDETSSGLRYSADIISNGSLDVWMFNDDSQTYGRLLTNDNAITINDVENYTIHF